MYKYILFSCLLIVSSIFGSTAHGARALGMGGAFCSVSDDANAIFWNPAGLCGLYQNAAIANYSSMYAGFCDDNLGNGAIGYLHRFKKMGVFALSTDMLYSDIYSQNVISLSYSRNFHEIQLGFRGNLLLSNYNKNNFYYTESDIAEDPLFSEYGYNTNAFSFDMGFLYSATEKIHTGLYLKNIIQPNQALSNIESKPPISYRFGLSYRMNSNSIISSDLEYLSEKVDDKNIQFYLGAEQWFFGKKVALRSGFNSNQFAIGSSLVSSKLLNIQIDYSFVYPISKLNSKSSSTHKFTLSSTFGPQKAKIVPTETKEIEPPKNEFIPPKPSVNISISPDELILDNLFQIEEEEPLVPIIFFDHEQSDVPKRFENLINTIATRLNNNPDLKLNIYGYFDSDLEDNSNDLPIKRAKAVKKKITNLHPELDGRLNVVFTGYDTSEKRSGSANPDDKKYSDLISQENRRVELHAEVSGVNRMLYADTFSPDVVINSFGSIILNNPDVDLIIESSSDERSLSEAFAKERIIEQELGYPGQQRTYISISDNSQKYIHLNADGAIYRPIKKRNALKYDANIESVDIDLEIDNPGILKEFSIDIVDQNGILFTNISQGKNLSKNYSWNFKDESGNFVDYNSLYKVRFSGIDTLGRKITATSPDNFKITVKDKIQLRSKQLIVQFQYNKDNPQVKYLEDKLEYITRRLIDMANTPHKNMDIIITGHTDIIGSERRNNELSEERAETEYYNIRSYFKAILKLKSDEELDDWLESQNMSLSFIGQGANEPYSISINDSEIETKTIGNNASPEGRTINRRVEIIILNEIK